MSVEEQGIEQPASSTVLNGVLFGDHVVRIDERATRIGGGWQGGKHGDLVSSWDAGLIEFVYTRLRRQSKSVLIDVGANTGTFSLLPAIDPSVTCLALEPSPQVLEILRSNAALNNVPNLTILPCAAGAEPGTAILKTPVSGTESGLANLGRPRFSAWMECEVAVETIDRLVQREGLQEVSVIKIDTEGAELFVLQGAEGTIRRHRPEIVLEVSEANARQFGYKATRVIQLLESWGYVGFEIGVEDGVFVHESLLSREISKLPRLRTPRCDLPPGLPRRVLNRLQRVWRS